MHLDRFIAEYEFMPAEGPEPDFTETFDEEEEITVEPVGDSEDYCGCDLCVQAEKEVSATVHSDGIIVLTDEENFLPVNLDQAYDLLNKLVWAIEGVEELERLAII